MPKTKIDIPSDSDDLGYDHRLTYRDLLDCPNIASFKESLIESIAKFEKEESVLKKAIQKSHDIFRKQPLLTAFLLWSKSTYLKPEGHDYAKILLENELIPFRDKRKSLLLIQDLDRDRLTQALELVRCQSQFDIATRESLVREFVNFFDWLSRTTLYVIRSVEDPDKIKTRSRILAHRAFTTLLEGLDDRCVLVAKLLYFGGSRTLDQVLSLQVKDVVFDKQIIKFGTQLITYPLHIFRDIRGLIGDRSSGRVFVGRQDSPMSPVTVFRNFKEAASQIGLGDSFSPKTLTTDC